MSEAAPTDSELYLFDYFLLVVIIFIQFTFGKVWLLYAQFEIRQKDLKAARQALVS